MKDLIVKNNNLIKGKFHFTLYQLRFISFMASKISKDDIDFFTYSVKLHHLLDILEVERKHISYLDGMLSELISKIVVIADNEEIISKTTILSFFEINKKDNLVSFRFDSSMKPFLLQLKENFTKISLEKILSLNSIYSIRFYELLQTRIGLFEKYKNKNVLEFEIDLEELKEMLLGDFNTRKNKIEIPKSYNRYSNFKQKILEVAKEELKEKGDYYFEYKEIKTSGKKVSSLLFSIKKNKDKIKKDFREKKIQQIKNSSIKEIVKEQIKRIMERNNPKDKLKYEQALLQKYLRGELKFDRDLQEIIDKKILEELKA